MVQSFYVAIFVLSSLVNIEPCFRLPNPPSVLIWCELAQRISKPPPIVTTVAAIIITIHPQLESDYRASSGASAAPSGGPSDIVALRVPTLGDGQ